MGDTLEVVALPVCEIVHGIHVPFCTGAVVRMLYDAVHDGIAEMHVRRGHVNLGTQNAGTFLELSGIHALEQIKILLGSTRTVGAVGTGHGWCTFLSGNLLGGLVVRTAKS